MFINKAKILNPIIPNIYKNSSGNNNVLFLDLFPNARTAYSVRKLIKQHKNDSYRKNHNCVNSYLLLFFLFITNLL